MVQVLHFLNCFLSFGPGKNGGGKPILKKHFLDTSTNLTTMD